MSKQILLVVAVGTLLFSSDAFGRGGRGGGNMMVCNAQAAPQPVQATATNLKKTTATKIVRPVNNIVHNAPIFENKTVLRFDMAVLQAMNERPASVPNTANIASK